MILAILTYEWPLTSRVVYNKTKKQYAHSMTYQSIYKSLRELIGKKVLLVKNKKYEINIGWIKKLQTFTDIVETNYFAKQRINSIAGLKDSESLQNLAILNFETVFDAEKYIYYFMKTELLKKRKLNVCYQIKNEWKPIFYFRAEYNYYVRLISQGHKIYFLTEGNSKIEQNIKKFYKRIGTKFKQKKNPQLNDTISFSDYVIQIFIPKKIKDKIHHHLSNMELIKLREVLSEKSSIKMLINKDEKLAKEIQDQITNQF